LNQKIPQHVAIIMDGNGRWAERQGLPRSDGHSAGVNVLKTIVKASVENKIKILSVWAFGSDNWFRPAVEVEFLMQLFVDALTREMTELHERGVRLCFTGNRSQLSSVLCEQMQKAESMTADNTQFTLNVVISYGGKWDLLQATHALAQQVLDGQLTIADITEDAFSKHLNTGTLPDPDLFIRTGGEQRISNFFLWQLAYTELYFSDVYWPDFSKTELEAALAWFAARERRYGRTSQQLLEEQYV
jgi:undecaprenyl diphosphate synthase